MIDPDKVFIIAEAGSNWRMGTLERDLEMGRVLIDIATEAGADAVKFQTYRSSTVYVENAGASDYLAESGIAKPINAIFDDLAMPYEMLPELAAYCESRGILFMSTPFSVEDAREVDPYVKIHKVASYEMNHVRLLQWLATTGKPLIISTGAAEEDEVETALDIVRKSGGKDVYLMQCTARYPAPLESLHLRSISYMRKKFSIEVGFSDHSRDPVVGPVAAVALGARLIEKHFTLHNRLPGADHPFALTPDELSAMVVAIRDAEKTLGNEQKRVDGEEDELRVFARRSLQALKDIRPGDMFVENENMAALRPGKRKRGLDGRWLEQVVGKRARRNIAKGDGINDTDITGWENEQ